MFNRHSRDLAGLLALACIAWLFARPAWTMDLVRARTGIDDAAALFGVSGEGVVIAILDRGIDWRHPDFIRDDGTTRIRWMLDMTGANGCDGAPQPIEYSENQINAALQSGSDLGMRDAVGHGTLTAGIAAGDGSGLTHRTYRGVAPAADLIVIKIASEGAPAHDDEPMEAPFQACIPLALDWLNAKLDDLNAPCVAILNSGVQWGPMDGTSIVSRAIDRHFGNQQGRIMIIPSGDEGELPSHAGGAFSISDALTIGFDRIASGTAFISGYVSGDTPAEVTVNLASGASFGPVGPGESVNFGSVWIINYEPGAEFYPWTSTSGDRAFWIRLLSGTGGGALSLNGVVPAEGRADIYHANLPNQIRFTNALTPGRLTDYASTNSALVVGAAVNRTQWTNLFGQQVSNASEGAIGALWVNSASGPTRDGRTYGVDVTAPGHNVFAAIAPTSWWATFPNLLIQGGLGMYGRLGATSGAAPIVAGACALLLEVNPQLTASQIRELLRSTAQSDASTGPIPSAAWGFGKLDVFAAIERAMAQSGDLNGDSMVNGVDLAVLLAQWGGPGAADLNNDGVVNGADLAALLANWSS